MRIGIGYDIHPLVPGRKLILGGIEIEHEKGLSGHSDADVLIHAVCDALLGAAALGDMGLHFPSSDERYKDEPSVNFLKSVVALIRQKRMEIGNIDSVIIAQEPRFSPFFSQMRETIAAAAAIPVEKVSVKGKSPEGIGSIGKGEAIVAHAIALLIDASER